MLLTDELLLDYKRCQRRAFLNICGNSCQRDPQNDFLLKLRQESQNHALNFLKEFYPVYHQPRALHANLQARAKETEALMHQGVECIYQGVLLHSGAADWGVSRSDFVSEKITFAGTPALLVKQPGKSKFGDWMYSSISIQLGRRPKPEYKIIAAFHAQILKNIQGVLPDRCQIVLRKQNIYTTSLESLVPRMQEVVAECVQMLSVRCEPEVFISRQRCGLCHWYTHCYDTARLEKHLSLVPGITPIRYQYLQTLGLKTLEALAAASPSAIGEVIGIEIANQLKQQAESILSNRAILKLNGTNRIGKPIPTAPVELYFDIEAEPERNLDYLLGVLLVDRQNNLERFHYFLAEKPEEEGAIWEQFLALVELHSDAPIFHFSEYEADTILRLAKLYKTPHRQTQSLLSRFVDLHHHVINSVTLPVESYSLKTLANWLGFQWRDLPDYPLFKGVRKVSGEQCVCWYDRWLHTGDRVLLEAILRYNEDDCRATRHLKDWLVNFFYSLEAKI